MIVVEAAHCGNRLTSKVLMMSGPFFLSSVFFNYWEFYAICVQELVLTVVMGVIVTGIISLFFIPRWTPVFYIVPLACVLNIELLGVLQWAGMHIDTITYVTVILGVGLFVDYLMHVLFRYYESPGHRHEKIVDFAQHHGGRRFWWVDYRLY